MQSTDRISYARQPVSASAVAVVIRTEETLLPLLSTGLATAKMHHGTLTVFFVTPSDSAEDWFALPAEYDSDTIVQQSIIIGKKCVSLLIISTKQIILISTFLRIFNHYFITS